MAKQSAQAVGPDLLGEEKLAVRPARRRGDVQVCLDAYHDGFVARFGFKPRIVGGKDGKHFKDLLALWGRDEVLALLREFLTTTDPRVLRSDYTIGAFSSLAQHLRLRQAGNHIDARQATNVDAAVRATRQRGVRRV